MIISSPARMINFFLRLSRVNKLINRLSLKHRHRTIKQQTINALQADSADPEYQIDLIEWDTVAGDGINEPY